MATSSSDFAPVRNPLHAPLLLLWSRETEATITVEDWFAGCFVDHVAQLPVLFPRAVCLNADDVNVLLDCWQHEVVVPHHHVLVAKNQVVRVMFPNEPRVQRVPLFRNDWHERQHVFLRRGDVGRV